MSSLRVTLRRADVSGAVHRPTPSSAKALEEERDALLRWFFELYDRRCDGVIDHERYVEFGTVCPAWLTTVLRLLRHSRVAKYARPFSLMPLARRGHQG